MVLTSKCIVKNIREIDEKLKLITFKIDKYIPWEPGMFLQLSLDKYDPSKPWPDSRAFSFASYGEDEAKILVRREGEFTTRLFSELKENSEFFIRYSFGEFLLSDPGDKVFIAAGTGISVFLSYIDYAIKENIKDEIIIFHSVKNSKELMINYLDKKIPDNIKLITYITREKIENYPNKRIEIEDILNKIDEKKDYNYYICGSDSFVKKYESELMINNKNKIYSESWDKNFS
jgi:NAD(P)H-flavin reductase